VGHGSGQVLTAKSDVTEWMKVRGGCFEAMKPP